MDEYDIEASGGSDTVRFCRFMRTPHALPLAEFRVQSGQH